LIDRSSLPFYNDVGADLSQSHVSVRNSWRSCALNSLKVVQHVNFKAERLIVGVVIVADAARLLADNFIICGFGSTSKIEIDGSPTAMNRTISGFALGVSSSAAGPAPQLPRSRHRFP
jgi:hypothetical protein